MRVPDEVLKCVVFIGREHGFTTEWIGTAFLVLVEEQEGQHQFNFPYLVTANHVAKLVEAAPFKVRANTRSAHAVEISANECGDFRWYGHPKGSSIDVAVCPWRPAKEIALKAIRTGMFFAKEHTESDNVGPGDEVIISGLFAKVTGKTLNLPIVRVGNLALAPTSLSFQRPSVISMRFS